MPELVKNPDFTRTNKRGTKYDFTPYADGNAYLFKSGEDYTSKPASFVQQVRTWGKANGYDVENKVELVDPDDEATESSVLVRFTPATDDGDEDVAKADTAEDIEF